MGGLYHGVFLHGVELEPACPGLLVVPQPEDPESRAHHQGRVGEEELVREEDHPPAITTAPDLVVRRGKEEGPNTSSLDIV